MSNETLRRAFEGLTETPCLVCLELATAGVIQARAVMPLPEFPARSRYDNRPCCRDCQVAEVLMVMGGHPKFGPSRLTVANERCEGLVMPFGMMEHFGLCYFRRIEPCSLDDLNSHCEWLESHGIPDSCSVEPFCIGLRLARPVGGD